MKMKVLNAGHANAVLVFVCVLLAGVCSALLLASADHQIKQRLIERSAYDTVAANPNPVIVCRNGIVEIVNPAAEQALGVRQADLLGKDSANVIVPEEFKARHIAATSRLKMVPLGSYGHSNYILPAKNALTGKDEKWLVTAQYYRRTDTGDVITIARFVNFVLSKDSWTDVTNNKKYRVEWQLVPQEETEEVSREVR